MPRDLTFSLYNHKKDNKTQLITKPWEDWIPILTSHEVRGNPSDADDEKALNEAKNGPAIILGPVQGKRSSNNVKEIHAFGLDIDDSTYEELKIILDKLSPYEHIVYTTHKHGSKIVSKPRIRIILPILEPINPKDYPSAWTGLQRLTGGAIDESTKDSSRLHFLPSTFDLSLASSHHNEGRWITLEDLPSPQAIDILDPEQIDLHTQIVESLRRLPKNSELKTAIDALLNGAVFAEPSNRHNTIRSITFYLARKFPTASKPILKKLFFLSLTTMQSTQSDVPSFESVWTAFEGAKAKIKESLGASSYTYSPQTLQIIADRQNCSVEELQSRWIIQKDGGGWVLDRTGDYKGYFSFRDFPVAIRKYLAGAPIELYELNAQNQYKRKNIEELLGQYGDIAQNIVSDMSIQYTTYDSKTGTLYEAVSPLRDLKPVYDKHVDQWLRLLFASNPNKGLSWTATCPDLTRQTCAVYFSGPPDSGKTIFAQGMAKLWTENAPADAGLVLSDFNEELVRCPLVLADEELPKKFSRETVTTKLRAMLSTTSRSLSRKYKPPSALEGAIRLVMAANNDTLLDTDELLSEDDLKAIAQRFMFVPIGPEAKEYLSQFSREETAKWIDYKIAEHALWLQENYEIKELGKRFAVEGDVAQMHKLLLIGAPWSSLVCEWLVRYLMNPMALDNNGKFFILRRNSELWVNNQVFVEGWNIYLGNVQEKVNSRKINTAIKTISITKDPKQKRVGKTGKKRRWYRQINVEYLIHWSNEYNIGDEETIKANLAIDFDYDEDEYEPKEKTDSKVVPLDRGEREGFEKY